MARASAAAKILLVDDEPRNLVALEAVLQGEGRHLVQATSAEEALKHILREDFAVIVLDVLMPGMDGFELASLVRSRERSRHTPIIFVTAARKEEPHVVRGYKLGAADYILKPFDPDSLRAKVGVFVDLFRKSEEVRRQAEHLAETTAFLNGILESTDDYAITALDLDGVFQMWPEGARSVYGYEPEEMVGRRRLACLHTEEDVAAGRLERLLERALQEGKAEGVFEQVRKNGERFSASVVLVPRTNAQSVPVGYVAITRDITERLRAEEMMLELAREQAARAEAEAGRERLQDLFMQSPAYIAVLRGPDHVYEFVNPLYLQIVGRRDPAQLIGKPIREALPEVAGQGYFELMNRVYTTGEPFVGHELRVLLDRRGDGTLDEAFISFVLQPSRTADGKVDGLLTHGVEVTELVRARRRAEGLAERLSLAQAAAGIGTFEWDLTTNEFAWTAELEALYGLPSGGFGGRYEDWANALHPEDRERAEREFRQAAAGGADLDTQFRVVWPIGAVRHLAAKGRVVRDEQGAPARMVGVNVDVTAHEAARERLAFLAEASRQLAASLDYEATLGSVARLAVPRLADWCAVDMVEPDGQVRRLAAAHRDPAKEEVAREVQRRYPPDPDAPRGIFKVLRTGQPELYPDIRDAHLVEVARDAEHLELLRAAGFTSAIVVPLVARGRTLGIISFVTAESGRRYGEADLSLAEELARVCALAIDNARLYRDVQEAVRARDQFMSVSSHELRNPVAGVKVAAQALQRARERGTLDDERLERSLRAVAAGADRLARLTDDLLDVARLRTGRLELRLRRLDLSGFVREAVERNRAHLTDRHTLELDIRDRCELMADPDRLEQVLANLLGNAVKYAPGGGPIRVAVRPEGAGVLVEVRDPGIGLPAGAAEDIFEPFGRAENAESRQIPGMGLGLHICRQIVELHGGRIWAESPGQGQGTTMRIWLPCAERTVGQDPAVGAPPAECEELLADE